MNKRKEIQMRNKDLQKKKKKTKAKQSKSKNNTHHLPRWSLSCFGCYLDHHADHHLALHRAYTPPSPTALRQSHRHHRRYPRSLSMMMMSQSYYSHCAKMRMLIAVAHASHVHDVLAVAS
jgi:hypothetical protein